MQKLIISLLAFFLMACGQTSNGKIKTNIQNTKTNQHINIPGTRLYIVLPPDFTIAKTFIGLQKSDKALLNIYDLIGGNFYTNAAGFSKSAFEQKGVHVFDFQEIKINGYPAKFISAQGADGATKEYELVFGDSTFSTMIISSYPANDEVSGKQILEALNTIYYDKNKKINPFETAFFTLDDRNSKFKFFQYNANMYIYTSGGTVNMKGTDDPVVLVSQFPMDNSMSTKSIAEMMIAKAQQYGLTNPEIKNISTNSINGYDTYEAEIYGQMQGKNSLIYQCIVAKDDKVVTIQGIAKNEMEANIKGFKNLSRTIQIK